ncbi:hypothetical protein FRC11_008921, partial [Ceratobasidium sp. 423]
RSLLMNTWELIPQDAVDTVFWYHELGDKLENLLTEELKRAWWTALDEYLSSVQGEGKGPNPYHGGNELESLIHQCADTLRDLVRLGGAQAERNCTRSRAERLQPASPKYSQLQD